MTKDKKKWLLIAVLLMVFAGVKVVALFWWQAQQPVAQNRVCQITQSPCVFEQNGAMQLLGVDKNHTPFTIRATQIPDHVQQITASFTMRDMDMGFNRFVLQKQKDGVWLAENVRLPLCTQSRHDWQIHWQVDGRHFQADFQTRP